MRYEDKDYTKSIQGNVEKVSEAVKIATQKKPSTKGDKRKTTDKATSSKKQKMWLGVDDLSEDDSESNEDDNSETKEFDEKVTPDKDNTPENNTKEDDSRQSSDTEKASIATEKEKVIEAPQEEELKEKAIQQEPIKKVPQVCYLFKKLTF